MNGTIRHIEVGEVSLLEKDVIFIQMKDDLLIEYDAGLEMVRTIEEIANGKNVRLIIDTGERNIMADSAKAVNMNQRIEHFVLCEAMIIDSLTTRITAHFYHKIYKPSFPIRSFKDFDKALAWCYEF